MNEFLTQQLKKSFGEEFDREGLSSELKDFITQVETSYAELTRKNTLLDNTLNNIYSELNESNKKVIERNHDLFELLERRSTDLEIQTEEADKAHNLLSQYREAIDNTLIVTMTDPQGIITYVNSAFCDISGYETDELLHRPHNIVRHPDMPKEVFQVMWETLQAGKKWKGIVKNLKKDATSYWVDASISPIFDIKGEVVEYIAIRLDLTDIILLNEEIRNTPR